MSQWVRHISGQGVKWEVQEDLPLVWRSYDRGTPLTLPKSEYRLCDPPEQWVDVTAECEIQDGHTKDGVEGHWVEHKSHRLANMVCGGMYRLRKVQVWNGDGATQSMSAFIVERKAYL